MPGRDLKIDPETGDYVSDGAGGYETTTDASTAMYHQIRGNLGQWAGDPKAGSRLHEFDRAKSFVSRTEREIVDAIDQALKPLVDASLITAPEHVTERTTDRVVTETTVRDRTTGQVIDLSDVLPSLP